MPISLLILLFSVPLKADVLTLRNGTKMTGIVRETTDETTELQVDAVGSVFLDKTTLASVQLDTPKKNKEIEEAWKAQALDESKKAQALEEKHRLEERTANSLQQASETEMVYHDGAWMPKEEWERRQGTVARQVQTNRSRTRRQRKTAPRAVSPEPELGAAPVIEAPKSYRIHHIR